MASAPTLEVAKREVVAVEHPMVVKDLDNALKTFGRGVETTGRPYRRVSPRGHVLPPPSSK
jgi:general transcription factor 3C polypeptide 5 (transcription factor C subunit 1)